MQPHAPLATAGCTYQCLHRKQWKQVSSWDTGITDGNSHCQLPDVKRICACLYTLRSLSPGGGAMCFSASLECQHRLTLLAHCSSSRLQALNKPTPLQASPARSQTSWRHMSGLWRDATVQTAAVQHQTMAKQRRGCTHIYHPTGCAGGGSEPVLGGPGSSKRLPTHDMRGSRAFCQQNLVLGWCLTGLRSRDLASTALHITARRITALHITALHIAALQLDRTCCSRPSLQKA